MESSSEEKKVNKRTPQRRARARRVSAGEKVVREKKTVARKLKEVSKREVPAPEPEVFTPKEENKRKAPTPFAFKKALITKKRKRIIVASTVFIIGIASSAAVGVTDSGQIDVQKTVQERNDRIRNNAPDERDILISNVEVPVQNKKNLPDGGLVGYPPGYVPESKPVIEPELSSSTATSSEEVASSTEEYTGSEVEEQIETEIEEESLTLEEPQEIPE